jgi:DNA segregation ATPase FtsK/SpoIIIE, S-DNA-T family
MTDFASGKGRAALLPVGADKFIVRRVEETSGLLLLLLAAALFLAYLSYYPADPSPLKATGGPIRNLLGAFGATVSDIGLQTLGLAHLGLIGILAAWGWRLFADHGLTKMWLRVSLLPPTLICAALAAGALPHGFAYGLPAGPGGVIGELAFKPIVALGPMIGGASRSTIGLVAAAFTGFLAIWTLGFGGREWREIRKQLRQLRARAQGLHLPPRPSFDMPSISVRVPPIASGLGGLLNRKGGAKPVNPFLKTGPESQAERAEPRFGLPVTTADAPRAAITPDAPVNADALAFVTASQAATVTPPPTLAPKPSTETVTQKRNATKIDSKVGGFKPTAYPGLPEPSGDYALPPINVLLEPPAETALPSPAALEQNARLLESVLEDFGVRGEIVNTRPGPVVTMYELDPAPGTKSARVIGLAEDIARSMAAIAVRIATVPGRTVIGIEVPNARRETVFFRDVLTHPDFADPTRRLPLVLGKDIGGTTVVTDLARMPHLLIAGTTGSGKSVGINAMILSLLYRLTPEQCRLIMIDPKMLELSVYDGIPHLLTPVVTDPKKAVVALKWAVREMENRYRAMAKLGVRNIEGYNTRCAELTDSGASRCRRVQVGFDDVTGTPLFEDQALNLDPLPYIVIVVDEMADLMLVAGKEIEATIQRLAQMARAAGIHLIMATQRPSVDVITGTIKANFPTRISFQVTSKIDSRTILGESGAEQLLGQGDMLYMAGGGRITRVHGPFVSDSEVEQIAQFLRGQGEPAYVGAVLEEDEAAASASSGESEGDGDGLYDQAVALVARERKASTSFIQRHLQIGYNRAARLVERMESEGVVSGANHVGKREVLVPKR